MPRRAERKRFGDAVVAEIVALLVREDHGRRSGSDQLDRRDRQAEDCAQVQLELVRELRDQRHHAGVVRTRATAPRRSPGRRGRRTRRRRCRGRRAPRPPCAPGTAPTAAPRAECRPAASSRDSRRASCRWPIGAQNSTPSLVATVSRVISLSNLMNSSTITRGRSPRMFVDRIIPGGADLVGRLGGALALARARHHRLDHARAARPRRPPRWPPRGSRRSDIAR